MDLHGTLWNSRESHGGVEKILEKAMAYNNELFIDGKKCPRNSTILLGNPLKFTELHGLICMEFHGLVEEIENMYFLVCAYPLLAMEFVGIPWNSGKF